jgi:signal transduction histidine kinase
LSLAEERERRRIATGLHDDACQNLVLSKMKLQRLPEPLPQVDLDEIADICETIDRTLESIRGLIFDLSSPTLYRFGLEAAIKELLEDKVKAQGNLRGSFHDDGAAKPLAQDVRVLLFQSVRELLNNVLKHARAHSVTVDIARLDDMVRVTVADDGVGFEKEDIPTGPSRSRGFGLFSIKERLDLIGGRLDIDSQPGRGSRFTLLARLATEARAAREADESSPDSAG